MSKRPLYVLSYGTEYEGESNDYIIYVGDNYKALKARHSFLHNYVLKKYYLDENIEPDRIEDSYTPLGDRLPDYGTVSFYICDDNDYRVYVTVTQLIKGAFRKKDVEIQYLVDTPNAKY